MIFRFLRHLWTERGWWMANPLWWVAIVAWLLLTLLCRDWTAVRRTAGGIAR